MRCARGEVSKSGELIERQSNRFQFSQEDKQMTESTTEATLYERIGGEAATLWHKSLAPLSHQVVNT